jgi:hypothetical protein
MRRFYPPQFPQTGSSSAVLLIDIIMSEHILVNGEKWALEVYHLGKCLNWPLMISGVDIGVREVRLDWGRLSSEVRRLIPLFEHRHRLILEKQLVAERV